MVFGANGGLGKAVCEILQQKQMDFIAVTRTQVDFGDEAIVKFLSRTKIQGVINCAAYTNVDRAERERQLSFQVNANTPISIAKYCGDNDVPMVHFSTDYVFDGESEALPSIEAKPRPINFYGLSKLTGEAGILSLPKTTVIRTSWLYSFTNQTFPNKILAKVREGNEFGVVNDEYGCPTWVKDLAGYALHLLLTEQYGLFHGNSEGRVTRYQFAKRIESEFGYATSLIRPVESVLDTHLALRPKFGGLQNTNHSDWHWPNWYDSFAKASKIFR